MVPREEEAVSRGEGVQGSRSKRDEGKVDKVDKVGKVDRLGKVDKKDEDRVDQRDVEKVNRVNREDDGDKKDKVGRVEPRGRRRLINLQDFFIPAREWVRGELLDSLTEMFLRGASHVWSKHCLEKILQQLVTFSKGLPQTNQIGFMT